jgi:hypothetical protein
MRLVNTLYANNNEIQNFKVHQYAGDLSAANGLMFVNTSSAHKLKITLSGVNQQVLTTADGTPTLVRSVAAGLIPLTGAGGTIDAAYIPASTFLSYTSTLNSIATANLANAAIDVNNQKIINLADATNPQDAVNKRTLDAAVQGLDTKASVRACTNTNITLAGSAPTVIDSNVTLLLGDRVLVKGQTLPQENGIYVVTTLGTGANGTWARAADMDNWLEVPNAYTWVEEGATYADTGWVCTSNTLGTLGTTPIGWVQFNSAGGTSTGTNLGSGDSATVSATIYTGMNGNLLQFRSIKNAVSTPRISVNVVSNDVILDLASVTGTGNTVALSVSPVFTTPTLGVATATSINKVTITQPTTGSTLTINDGKTLTISNTMSLASTESAVLTFQGTDTYTGRATTDTLTNKTINFAVGGNVLQINSNTISSNTGTGSVNVLQNSPSLITPTLGVATATSINKVTITQPTNAATLTLADNSSLTTVGAFALTLTVQQLGNFTFPAQATGTLLTADSVATLTNKTFNTSATGNAFSINGTSISTVVPVAVGGTGGVTKGAARTNLSENTFALPQKYAVDCTTANPFTIAAGVHLLGATQDIQVYVYEKASGTQVFGDATVAANGDVSIQFSTAPIAAQFRIVLVG